MENIAVIQVRYTTQRSIKTQVSGPRLNKYPILTYTSLTYNHTYYAIYSNAPTLSKLHTKFPGYITTLENFFDFSYALMSSVI